MADLRVPMHQSSGQTSVSGYVILSLYMDYDDRLVLRLQASTLLQYRVQNVCSAGEFPKAPSLLNPFTPTLRPKS